MSNAYRKAEPYRKAKTYWCYWPTDSNNARDAGRPGVNETIAWTLDGKPIPMSGWSATMTAPGGYERFTGQTSAKLIAGADQGSELIGYRSGGGELWRGKLAAPPRILDGIAYLSCNGPREQLDSSGAPLLFQIRNASLFTPADSDPFDYNISEKYVIDAKNSQLRWKQRTVTYGSGNKAGFVMWVADNPITRMAFTINKSADDADFDLVLYNATGPDGTLSSAISTTGLGGGTPTGTKKDLDISASTARDLAWIGVSANGSTVTNSEQFWLSQFRINGLADARNYDSSGSLSWDIFFTSDVAAVLAERLGMGTDRIRTSALNILPLYWDSGTHAELLDYMSRLDDWRWLATGNGIEYGPWETTWDVGFGFHGNADLEPMRLYNRATVQYETTSGQMQSVSIDADPNPFASTGAVVELIENLSDAQDQDVSTSASLPEKQYKTLAEQYAEHLGEYYFTRRVRGDLNLASVGGDGGPQSPYAVRAGDMLNLVDYTPTIPVQRVVAVEYNPSGTRATLSEEINPMRRIAHGRGRQHRAKRNGGKR